MKALILAAGLGTRLMPYTEKIPKALVPVAGKPMILHLLERLACKGIHEFVVNLHHHADVLQQYLEQLTVPGISIAFSDERDALLDTGGALKRAAAHFDDGQPFLVHNVDVWSGTDPFAMLQYHQQTGAIATLAVRNRETKRKLLFDAGGKLAGRITADGKHEWVKNPSDKCTPVAFSGIQIVSPAIFRHFPSSSRFGLVEFYLRAAAAGDPVVPYLHDEDLWADLGTIEKIKSIGVG
ncbi:MAG TPA: sugar phosphate nucleotidyltransferase [Bacteroidales bacterium]|nr:sugar phosphate nucleotidyltransferase [Bacteroidales bacterium]HRZ49694.1 sugar phosphate nucleotidyltransferase [Bacteroidales bacterium]